MDHIAGELRKLADLKAARLISDEEHGELRQKVLDGKLANPLSTEKELVEHFAGEALRKHQQWRVQFEDFILQEKSYKEEDSVSRNETFVNVAKAGSVTPLERMLSTYSLYGTNADLTFFKALVANVPDEKRVEYHNWYVARACGEAFLSQYGAEIAAGCPPLFGPAKEFGPLNVAILKKHARELTGSGGKPYQACFDHQVEHIQPESKVIYAAGYAVPVDNGFVDLGIVEEAIAWLDFRVKELEAALTAAKVQVPTAERAKPATSRNNRYYDTNRYNNNGQGNNQGYNQSYNQNYNANYAPRGGRGGRGNRGGRGGRGYQGNY
eukprot:TRINITY_DN3029_c0_g1_i3.p1 TRINITY_DN3029_c0_g1~~TRINITY_DN3029_c0_g1_i3.p1  ORF type:complete len:324 (+),score=16.34 TRINITY_DN3029_c0_g1_i3:95-1066(+)